MPGLASELGIPGLRSVRRRRSEYRTSFPLEELDVELADGSEAKLALKRLDWDRLRDDARLAKPHFLHDPDREIAVYESALPLAPTGPPRFYGALAEPDRHLLLIEWVAGRELYQLGDLEPWRAAARWLAELHDALAHRVDALARELPLLEHGREHFLRWLGRAREFAPDRATAERIEWLGERHAGAVDELLAAPPTFVHGEFYASNVLVAEEGASWRIAPVDWELAGRGPGLLDLAALVSGGWGPGERAAIVDAYRAVAGDRACSSRQLDLARLQLAIQWLGWAPSEWTPPSEHRHDWLGEALQLAEELEL